ncbi:DNA topoisomerase IB [Candidatus Curtissbacteria bacterium]|nr:DNA topoisomerase IB [Candidatus Curtissbacteria bacterium]
MATEEVLRQARLRFTNDKKLGITRKIIGDKFIYYDRDGEKITDQETIDRINKLVIPPAYKRVWISPFANGHLQATGVDGRGRKQYRYHPIWNKISQEEKFEKIMDFAKHLPKIRSTVRRHLEEPRANREKVLAAVVWLLENTLIRVGNEEYEEENKSYGLTTLKNKHVSVSSTHNITFQFKGKSGVYHKVSIKSKKVARIIRRCREIPGQDLFEYFDEDGKIQTIDSYDVNEYLKEITGEEITAKDFRTWGGTVLAAEAFDKLGPAEKEEDAKQNVVNTVKEVAAFLRNRPATCRKYYIHPIIIDSYHKGYILSKLDEIPKKGRYRSIDGLDNKENNTMALLTYTLS